MKDFGFSPLGILLGIALVLAVLLGSCSVAEGSCVKSGGNWTSNLECLHTKGK